MTFYKKCKLIFSKGFFHFWIKIMKQTYCNKCISIYSHRVFIIYNLYFYQFFSFSYFINIKNATKRLKYSRIAFLIVIYYLYPFRIKMNQNYRNTIFIYLKVQWPYYHKIVFLATPTILYLLMAISFSNI